MNNFCSIKTKWRQNLRTRLTINKINNYIHLFWFNKKSPLNNFCNIKPSLIPIFSLTLKIKVIYSVTLKLNNSFISCFIIYTCLLYGHKNKEKRIKLHDLTFQFLLIMLKRGLWYLDIGKILVLYFSLVLVDLQCFIYDLGDYLWETIICKISVFTNIWYFC